jgi:hypothetical protein
LNPTKRNLRVTLKGLRIMDFVLNNQDIVDLIAGNMDFVSLSNIRLTCKKMNKYTKKHYIRSISKYSKFELKKKIAAEQIYEWMVENEMDYVADTIEEPVDFEVFYNEIHNNEVLYNLMLLNSDNQEDLDNKVQRLYNEFMDEFIGEE